MKILSFFAMVVVLGITGCAGMEEETRRQGFVDYLEVYGSNKAGSSDKKYLFVKDIPAIAGPKIDPVWECNPAGLPEQYKKEIGYIDHVYRPKKLALALKDAMEQGFEIRFNEDIPLEEIYTASGVKQTKLYEKIKRVAVRGPLFIGNLATQRPMAKYLIKSLHEKVMTAHGDAAMDLCWYWTNYESKLINTEFSSYGRLDTYKYKGTSLLTATIVKFKEGFVPPRSK